MKFVIRPIAEETEGKPWLPADATEMQRTRIEDPAIRGGKVIIDLTDDQLKWVAEQTGYNVTRECNDIRTHEFWGKKGLGVLTLEPFAKAMDDKNPLDLIQLGLARATDSVCNKSVESNIGMCPTATYELIADGEEIEEAAAQTAVRAKAYKAFLDMDNAQKVHLLAILSGDNASKQSQSYLDAKVEELIQKNPKEFLMHTDMDNKELRVRAVIELALMERVFVRQGTQVVYEDLVIGYDLEEAVKYLLDPQNQKFWLHIAKKVNE